MAQEVIGAHAHSVTGSMGPGKSKRVGFILDGLVGEGPATVLGSQQEIDDGLAAILGLLHAELMLTSAITNPLVDAGAKLELTGDQLLGNALRDVQCHPNEDGEVLQEEEILRERAQGRKERWLLLFLSVDEVERSVAQDLHDGIDRNAGVETLDVQHFVRLVVFMGLAECVLDNLEDEMRKRFHGLGREQVVNELSPAPVVFNVDNGRKRLGNASSCLEKRRILHVLGSRGVDPEIVS